MEEALQILSLVLMTASLTMAAITWFILRNRRK